MFLFFIGLILITIDSSPFFAWGTLVVGILTSGISGWLAVAGLLKLVRSKSFDAFVIYRVIAGVAILAIAASGWR